MSTPHPAVMPQPAGSPTALQLDVSVDTHTIAGISVHVYGLEQLPKNVRNVSCLYLMNPRLCNHHFMTGIAKTALEDHYKSEVAAKRGLIAATYDQRNHGEREVRIRITIPTEPQLRIGSNNRLKN